MVAQAHHAGLAAVRGPDPEMFPRALRRLEGVSLRAIRALLAAEGALPPGGPAKTAEEVAAALRAAPRHVWLVGRWLTALEAEGALARKGERYLPPRVPDDGPEDAESADGMGRRCPPSDMRGDRSGEAGGVGVCRPASDVPDDRPGHAEDEGARYRALGVSAAGARNAEGVDMPRRAAPVVSGDVASEGAGDVGALLRDGYAALGFPPLMARFHAEALARLGELVRDEVTVQQLLFRDGDVLGALAAYQDNVFTDYLNAACGRLLRRLAERGPAPPRIVELGGGGGAATAAVLRALDGVPTDYVFTDVSRAFTTAARERFGDRLSYRLLDINANLAAWAMTPGNADVVLAANVLHNAVNIGRTLGRIRRLLRPGGALVFTESIRENHVILTSMQFLLSAPPGRTRPGEADRRAARGEVFLDSDGWYRELAAAGFTPVCALPDADDPLAAAGQHLFWADAR
ncbi:class I SAM-dependent methyltransferase [Thermopolyspora sp. NPDC052614]|uniref:class I SAM-dependent methyltransferase n=1 Tax=Thermopolyspora sp. NPDC052614 TaxID=3155682 RepID=UPI003425545D